MKVEIEEELRSIIVPKGDRPKVTLDMGSEVLQSIQRVDHDHGKRKHYVAKVWHLTYVLEEGDEGYVPPE